MAFITFLKQWDRFNPGDTRMIEPTLSVRLIQSGIAKPFERQAIIHPTLPPQPVIVQEIEKPKKEVKPKRKRSDKRLKPSQKKGK